MFYLLVMLLLAYLLKFAVAFLFYLQRADFVQCYTVLSDFSPMKESDQCHVTK